MREISRRNFLKTASASVAFAAACTDASWLVANPLGLPLGLQLYSIRDLLPKDYEGTLRQLSAIGYREVEAAGFFGRSASDVKHAMEQAGLHCVSAHYSYADLAPHLDDLAVFLQFSALHKRNPSPDEAILRVFIGVMELTPCRRQPVSSELKRDRRSYDQAKSSGSIINTMCDALTKPAEE